MPESNRLSPEILIAGLLYLCLYGLTLLPPFGVVTIWLMPVPLTVLSALNHRVATAWMAGLYGLCLTVVGLNWAAVLFVLAIYFVAWSTGESIRKSLSPYGALLTGTLVFVMLELVLLALVRWVGIDLFQALTAQLQAALQNDSALLGPSVGQDPQWIPNVIDRVKMLMPAFTCTYALMLSALNLYLARLILRKRVQRPPVLASWRLPDWVIPLYILVLAVTLFHLMEQREQIWQVFNNAQFLLGLVIGIQGLSALWRWLSTRFLGRLWITMAMAAAVFGVVGSVCILIGLFDMIHHSYRKRSV